MYIIATEDNTPVTVKGDYDQLDLIVHKGDAINRDLVVETAQVHYCEGKWFSTAYSLICFGFNIDFKWSMYNWLPVKYYFRIEYHA